MAAALCESLGRDLAGRRSIAGYSKDQRFSGASDSVRLKRCGQVLETLAMADEWRSVQLFAQLLISRGANLRAQDVTYWTNENTPGPLPAPHSIAGDDVERFRAPQRAHLASVRAELGRASKETDWMWFVFPQVAGLGKTHKSNFYGFKSLDDATAYFQDGEYLDNYCMVVGLTHGLLGHQSLVGVFGGVDVRKLRSSLTVFLEVCRSSERTTPVIAMANELLAELGGACPRTVETVTTWRLD